MRPGLRSTGGQIGIMPTIDLFSKRQKRDRGEMPDVLEYEVLPKELRVQVVHILRNALGVRRNADQSNAITTVFEWMHDDLCQELGRLSLAEGFGLTNQMKLEQFLMSMSESTEHVLDAIELSFRYVDRLGRDHDYSSAARPQLEPDEAIADLNARFLEHGVGYRFEARQLIRIDSTLLHSEVVRPALQLLAATDYAGANAEYLKAHEHCRKGEHSACLVECLKSLESTMKVICKKRGWHYDQSDRAKKLIQTCFDNDLLPQYLQSHFTSVRCSLESGVPTVRNKVGGHGQGTEPVSVPQYLAEYLLHLTATSILFLVRAEQALD